MPNRSRDRDEDSVRRTRETKPAPMETEEEEEEEEEEEKKKDDDDGSDDASKKRKLEEIENEEEEEEAVPSMRRTVDEVFLSDADRNWFN